ncbi:sigma-70 family RNA polymerase sigma factor [Streptomyces sp. NPDC050095]|uniref:sigma-70 family RNA polymerase sigma factor n=1 Tax=unclassified Streptomyces TaxID=2593676 RepID=UPI00341C0D15
MTDGPAAAPIAEYARIYEAEQPRLVAYARSLTGSPWLADDLVAEAHFRVWRRLAAGHSIDNVAAYLTTTVRRLAATAGRGAARETPLDPQAGAESMQLSFGAYEDQDPASRAAGVDLLARVLGQLPERWVKALWLAEAEEQPLEAVGRRIGAGSGATAVLLHRAREGMRQAFLRAHPGVPEDPACEAQWDRMPAHVRGAASARQSEKLLAHVDTCDDCRTRLAVLLRANERLPALVGPALLVFVLGGAGTYLLPLAGGAGASAPAGAHAGAVSGGHGTGVLHGVRHGVRHALTGGAKAPAAVAGVLGVSVAGAAVAAGLVLTGSGTPAPPQRTAAVVGDAPSTHRDSTTPTPRMATPPSSKAVDPSSPEQRTPATRAEPARPPAPPRQATPPAAPAPATPPETAAPPTPEPAQPEPTRPEPTTPEPTTPEPTTPEPAGPTEPTEPTEPSQPTEPALPTEPPQPTAPPEPTEPTTEPTDPATEPTPEPSEPQPPAPTCEPWLGPLYICSVG